MSTIANQRQPYRSRFERTRTGCLTCRRRRKKCDEAKPVCKACERNNFDCTWPESSIRVAQRQNQHALQHQDVDEASPDTSGSSISSGAEDFAHTSFTEVNPEHTIKFGEIVHDFFTESQGLDKRRYNGYPVDVPMNLGKMPSKSENTQLLLQHYLEKTADVLGATPGGAQNPFVTRVIPLAFTDDLVMSSVLALSGVHLDSEQGSSSHIKNTTWHHYAYIIRSLKNTFSDISSCNASKALRILVVLIMLCHIEAISGNSESAVFAHLRAGRQLVMQLNARDADTRTSDQDHQVLRSFICETYAYIVLTANITPYGLFEDRIISVDPFIGSLTALEDGQVSGSFLSCGFKLFEMIPRISLLARTRLAEQVNKACTTESQATYEELHKKLSDWKSPKPHVTMMAWADEHMWAGEIYRNTLMVYLMVGMHPCPADRMGMIQDEIQQRIDIVLSLLLSIASSPFETIMLWPITIIGSCLVREDQQELVREGIKDTRWGQVKNVVRAIRLLESVWADSDEYVYGPYGLYLMMKKHDINPSIF